jgi:hypothetical protein
LFTDHEADACIGKITFPGVGVYTTMERGWHDNTPGISCVPPGFYNLKEHNGTKYQNTYALQGAAVERVLTPSVPRYACVFHWEDDGKYLQGCISVGLGIDFKTSKLLSKSHMAGFLMNVHDAFETEKVGLIIEGYGISS